jgi:hypothetical protein
VTRAVSKRQGCTELANHGVCVAKLEAEGLIRREKRYGKVLGRT